MKLSVRELLANDAAIEVLQKVIECAPDYLYRITRAAPAGGEAQSMLATTVAPSNPRWKRTAESATAQP
jgi:hypothetical protein